MQIIKSSGATLDQATMICDAKNKASNKYQWVVIDNNGYHVYRIDTIPKSLLKTVVKSSACLAARSDDSTFLSYHCLTCELQFCPYDVYKWGSGPR